MDIRITYKDNIQRVAPVLPPSKSMLNRELMIRFFQNTLPLELPEECGTDNHVLLNCLQNAMTLEHFDVADSGTALRFLTALFSVLPGTRVLYGTPGLNMRPLQPLTAALKDMGADIRFSGMDGFAPVQISGKNLKGGLVTCQAGQSSQFVSALMLIAPLLNEGLQIICGDEPASEPYIRLTAEMMRKSGVSVQQQSGAVTVGFGNYSRPVPAAEPDWSAAAFWFQTAALNPALLIEIPGLKLDSLQGDSACAGFFGPSGIRTEQTSTGIRLQRTDDSKPQVSLSFRNHPDLFPPALATYSAMGTDFRFTGIKNLKIKESDRIQAMISELGKLGFGYQYKDDSLGCTSRPSRLPDMPVLNSHNDHRVAMALAPLAFITGNLTITGAESAAKSYPGFWKQIRLAGLVTEFL